MRREPAHQLLKMTTSAASTCVESTLRRTHLSDPQEESGCYIPLILLFNNTLNCPTRFGCCERFLITVKIDVDILIGN